ncbi:hypothetical protein NEOLEDRAFT_1084521 [Neolentinus lepideus HHB14362 ss-1]|uniref:Uncharacterized protein n=1 Tax=Neolentinus lepideus HHB14362 ss-1 TaxID=1314782 RepID=A0A165VJ68_9AGAM|nr:hypothetical protein NEOLEDRAFT_1084521 [Neolentinus lepideus HHB14362 ss-1]
MLSIAVRSVARPSRAWRHAPSASSRTFSNVPARQHPVPATYKNPEMDDPQLNGYPRLPYVSRQYLPPKGWDDPQMRRNFGDTMHEQEEILSMWGPDIPVVPPQTALLHFGLAVLGFVGIGVICVALTPDIPALRRQYPYDGLKKELGGLEENKVTSIIVIC